MAETATVRVERHIAAPPAAVYDAWLHPDRAGNWLFRTEGGALERCEIDARVGGGFRIDERRGNENGAAQSPGLRDGGPILAEHFGEYVALDRPSLIAFDFWTSFSDERTRITIEIAPDGDGAILTLTHEGVWADYEERTRKGWTTILENLAGASS